MNFFDDYKGKKKVENSKNFRLNHESEIYLVK